MPILESDRVYLFSQFTEFSQPPAEILAELGYEFNIDALSLPKAETVTESALQATLARRIKLTPLTSEQARREALVAPVLFAIADSLNLQLNIEYPLSGKRGKGNLDYLMRGRETLLVIEAKRDDLTRGFTQLAIEMIELAEATSGQCYGAVTTGNIWQFAVLEQQTIVQDLTLYRVPTDVPDLLAVLMGILG